MKKLSLILVLGLLMTNKNFASIITFNCSNDNQYTEYEINERIFDTQGYYLTIKKEKIMKLNIRYLNFQIALGLKSLSILLRIKLD